MTVISGDFRPLSRMRFNVCGVFRLPGRPDPLLSVYILQGRGDFAEISTNLTSGFGPNPKSNLPVIMSAIGGKADVPQTSSIGSY